jgi:hypothetical protein
VRGELETGQHDRAVPGRHPGADQVAAVPPSATRAAESTVRPAQGSVVDRARNRADVPPLARRIPAGLLDSSLSSWPRSFTGWRGSYVIGDRCF